MNTVVQARQQDDAIFTPLQVIIVPPGGTAFIDLAGTGLVPTERDLEGFAAIAGVLASTLPFKFNIYQYYVAGGLIGERQIASQAEPITGFQRIDFTNRVTGKVGCFEVANANPVPIMILAHIKLRPVSCYDQDIVFDPTDILTVKKETGSTIIHRNVNSGGVSTPMFAANPARIEIIGINLGPRPITISFGVAAVFGAGQTVPANTPFRLDTTPVAVNFIDDGGAGNALISATQISTP